MMNILKDRKGCYKVLAILFAIILVASFIAAMISSNGGQVKIESVMIDGRGAELSADLYYPAAACFAQPDSRIAPVISSSSTLWPFSLTWESLRPRKS